MSTEASLYPEDALSVLEAIPTGVFIENSQGEITWANHTASQQLGVSSDEFIGQQFKQLPLHKTLKLVKLSEPAYIPDRQSDTCLQIKSAEVDGALNSAVVYCIMDITALAAQSRFMPELRQPASLDPVTGLMNCQHINQELVTEVSRSRRYENPLSLILLQVPSLSSDDDKLVAEVLKENLRWVDLVGHWEVDQILIVLPETDAEAAQALSGKIESHFSRRYPEKQIRMAVTEWQKGDDTNAMLVRAEAQLGSHPASRVN